MQITSVAERLGAAASLLSLDRIVPYYTAMGLTRSQGSAEAVKSSVRDSARWSVLTLPSSISENAR